MKNSIKVFIYIFFLNFIFFNNSFGNDEFEFNVTEIEIKENGNKIKGFNRGTITSDNGIVISADTFNYDKKLNFLSAEGNVLIEDKLNKYLILTNKINYDKNNELIITFEKSEAIIENITINAVNFKYDKNKNILNAINDVKIIDKINDYLIFSENIKTSLILSTIWTLVIAFNIFLFLSNLKVTALIVIFSIIASDFLNVIINSLFLS